ncbi:hypothetical protein GI582_24400 [Sulfitobacter sp. BDSS02]|uniref:hypothetical protein n=1 Tax=Heliomarina sp. TaxID=2917556 RepID=UPI0040597116|nr:hypothetical protein [Sulfitobacter sp. BDSS02]MBR9852433.1 hypothetical protein [Paracoccaceae bacterium]
MLRTFLSVAILCLGTAPAFAQNTETVDLPAGQITLQQDGLETRVSGGSQQLVLEAAYLPDVYATWRNSVLLFAVMGGTACPGLFHWVTLDAAGLRSTESFGTCSDLGEVEQTDAGPMLKLPRGDGGYSGFLFNGTTVIEQELGLASAGVSQPSNASAWKGYTAYKVLTSAEMEPVLLTIMDWNTLDDVRWASSVSNDSMTRDGDWFAAVGCQPHLCSEVASGVAISARDGRVITAFWRRGEGGVIYGQPDSALPNKLRELLQR